MATGRAGVPTIRQYVNMFKDILETSGYRYGFGKHMLDKTERVNGLDDLFTHVRAGELRLGRRPSYSTTEDKQTVFFVDVPVTVDKIVLQTKYTPDATSTLIFEVSADNGSNYAGITMVHDPTRDVQTSEETGVPSGNQLKIRVTMGTSDANITPVVEWFMILFNGV